VDQHPPLDREFLVPESPPPQKYIRRESDYRHDEYMHDVYTLVYFVTVSSHATGRLAKVRKNQDKSQWETLDAFPVPEDLLPLAWEKFRA
jgi:hypothetical protein